MATFSVPGLLLRKMTREAHSACRESLL